MFINVKKYLKDLKRIRIPEKRNLNEGLRLDRNEKVDIWPKKIVEEIFCQKPEYFLSVYPDQSNVYRKISQFDSIPENTILLTSGIDGGIKTLFEIMTKPGDLVGVVSPTYAMYTVYSKIFQTELININYKSDLSFDFTCFEEFLNQRPVMFFLPNPNQPIESAFNISELEEFAIKTKEANCLFIIDEAYFLFGCDTGISLVDRYENVVIARTFSKGFGVPSIRLGYLVSNHENMKILSKTRNAHESNSVSNAVAEYLLDNYSIVKNYNSEVIISREYTKNVLTDMGIKAYGAKGNYLLLDLESKSNAEDYVRYLNKNYIYVKGPWKDLWENYITITIGPKNLMEKFLKVTNKFITTKIK